MSEYPHPGVIVDIGGYPSAVVNFTSATDGSAPTVYADQYGVTPITLPDTITSRTTFFMKRGSYVVSGTVGGSEMLGYTIHLERSEVACVTIVPSYPIQFGIDEHTVCAGNDYRLGSQSSGSGLPVFNVANYGALGTGVANVNDGTWTAGSHTFASASLKPGSYYAVLPGASTDTRTVTACTNNGTTVTASVNNNANFYPGQPITFAGMSGFTTNNPNGTFQGTSFPASGNNFSVIVGLAPTGSYTGSSGTASAPSTLITTLVCVVAGTGTLGTAPTNSSNPGGSVCNWAVDVTPAAVLAEAAAEASGGIVYFPPGVWGLNSSGTSQLQTLANGNSRTIYFQGAGPTATTLLSVNQASSGNRMLTQTCNGGLLDLTLNCNNITGGYSMTPLLSNVNSVTNGVTTTSSNVVTSVTNLLTKNPPMVAGGPVVVADGTAQQSNMTGFVGSVDYNVTNANETTFTVVSTTTVTMGSASTTGSFTLSDGTYTSAAIQPYTNSTGVMGAINSTFPWMGNIPPVANVTGSAGGPWTITWNYFSFQVSATNNTTGQTVTVAGTAVNSVGGGSGNKAVYGSQRNIIQDILIDNVVFSGMAPGTGTTICAASDSAGSASPFTSFQRLRFNHVEFRNCNSWQNPPGNFTNVHEVVMTDLKAIGINGKPMYNMFGADYVYADGIHIELGNYASDVSGISCDAQDGAFGYYRIKNLTILDPNSIGSKALFKNQTTILENPYITGTSVALDMNNPYGQSQTLTLRGGVVTPGIQLDTAGMGSVTINGTQVGVCFSAGTGRGAIFANYGSGATGPIYLSGGAQMVPGVSYPVFSGKSASVAWEIYADPTTTTYLGGTGGTLSFDGTLIGGSSQTVTGRIGIVGYTPVGNLGLAAPNSGTSKTYPALPYNWFATLKANTTGTTTYYTGSQGSGNAVTLAALGIAYVPVSAGDTLTVTYTASDYPTISGVGL